MFCALPQMWLRWRVAVTSWSVPVGNYWTPWCISWETWSQDSVTNLKCMLTFFSPFKWNALSCSAAQVMTVVFPLSHYSLPGEEAVFSVAFLADILELATRLYPSFVSLWKSLKHHNTVKVSRGALIYLGRESWVEWEIRKVWGQVLQQRECGKCGLIFIPF